MSAVLIRDQIIHYEVLGRGRPLIFLHGWVGSWRYWVPAMQAASQAFRAYAIDLWGFGDSAKNPAFYSLDQQVNLLAEFFNEMGIGKVAFIGHGLGSVVALQYTARHPHMVDRIMAVSLPRQYADISAQLRSSSPQELADWLLSGIPNNQPILAEVAKTDVKALSGSLADLERLELSALTTHTNTACLMVHGQEDPLIQPLAVEGSFALPDHVHYIGFEQSAHFPMLDEASKFNRLLTDFLNLASGEDPRQLQLKEEWKRRVR